MQHPSLAYTAAAKQRGFFYDVRNLPYAYYGMHPMDVVEYQRGRPNKLHSRLLNRQFKAVLIPLGGEGDQEQLSISVIPAAAANATATGRGKAQPSFHLVLSVEGQKERSAAEGDVQSAVCTGSVSIPENLAPRMVQKLRKLAKWRPTTEAGTPTPGLPTFGQGLVFEDSVFKAQIVPQLGQHPTYAIKIFAETRSRNPQDRRELASVLLPMDANGMAKLKTALAELVITESPLYHTTSMQASDGSKFYLDLIKEEAGHYLKVSHVTRDFRSIVVVPACDVTALRDLLDSSQRAMQQAGGAGDPPAALSGKSGGSGKRKAGRSSQRRRRNQAAGQKQAKRGDGGGRQGETGGEDEEKENDSAATAEATDAEQRPEPKEKEEDAETVESCPVEPEPAKTAE